MDLSALRTVITPRRLDGHTPWWRHGRLSLESVRHLRPPAASRGDPM